MTTSTVLAAVLLLLLLLALDWRYQRPSIRLGVTLLTFALLFFAQPNHYRAFRRAILSPPTERIASTASRTLVEYESGVYTMRQALAEEVEEDAIERTMAMAVLVWLAASPVLRINRRSHDPPPAVSERDA